MLHLRNLQCEGTCELPYYSVNNISTVDVHYNLYGQMQLANLQYIQIWFMILRGVCNQIT